MRLDAWRAAERRRDSFVQGSPEWLEADEAVRVAETRYRAEFAQALARSRELAFDYRIPRAPAEWERRTPASED